MAAWIALVLCTFHVASADIQFGVNLNGDDDYRSQALWADVTDQFRGWFSTGDMTDSYKVGSTDIVNGYSTVQAWVGSKFNGYPTNSDGTITFTYSYDGAANSPSLVFGGDAVNATSPVFSNGHYTGTVTYKPGNDARGRGFVIQYNVTQGATPVTNLQIYLPGQNLSNTLSDAAAHRLSAFSTVRYMDLQQTNNDTTTTTWANRTQGNAFIQNSSQGVSIEKIVAASNQMGNNLWISIPVNATNDYLVNLGKYLGDKVSAGQKVYVEYGNELWNSGTAAGKQMNALATAKTNGVYNLYVAGDDTTAASYTATLEGREQAVKLLQIKTQLSLGYSQSSAGTAGYDSSVNLVYGGWTNPSDANYTYTTAGLAYFTNLGTTASSVVKSLAISGYVDTATPLTTTGMTLDQVFAEMNAELDVGGKVYQGFLKNKQLADAAGLSLSVYEAGQSLLPTISGSLAVQAQNDPRMALIYHRLIEDWRQVGGTGPFNLYSYADTVDTTNSSGAWGLLASGNDKGSVKWDAVLREMLKAGDINLDGKVNNTDVLILESNFGKSGLWWEQGNFNSGDTGATATTVDAADFLAMYANLSGLTTDQMSAVQQFATNHNINLAPEPGAGCLLLLSSGLLTLRRRSRCASSSEHV